MLSSARTPVVSEVTTNCVQVLHARGVHVIHTVCPQKCCSDCLIFTFQTARLCARNGLGVLTFHSNTLNGLLVQCVGLEKAWNNEKSIRHAYVSPFSPLLPLECCISVYYDLTPAECLKGKNVHEYFPSTGSQSDLWFKYFVQGPSIPVLICQFFAHRKPECTRNGSKGINRTRWTLPGNHLKAMVMFHSCLVKNGV